MADRPIIYPRLLMRTGSNRFEEFGGEAGYSDNNATGGVTHIWAAGGTLVVLTSGLLEPVVTDGVLAVGFCMEASATSAAVNPPTSRRNPNKHFPFNLRDVIFLMNITDASGNVGVANSAPQLSAVTIGQSYAILRPTSGTYTGYQMLDSSDTTNTLVTVVDKPVLVDGVANVAATYNGIVAVKIIPSKLQTAA